ncbi:MAG TPA: peptidoglycan DD-metalloendopeptidase family protein [Candidatus Aquabacterium excrementipullorum]|nr:peptidoglycan DD-metalloendopeptidase family protein [Candidatus Aquabacterium excrementipullorum]
MYNTQNTFRLLAAVAAALTFAGCATPINKAPVEDRGRVGTGLSPARLPPGGENAGKAGYYTVKPGDTLIRVALETGQNWRDLATWNNLENPNLIEVGQVLRVVSPSVDPTTVAATPAAASVNTLPAAKPVTTSRVEARNLDAKPQPAASGSSTASSAASSASKPASAGSEASTAAATTAPATAASSSDSKDTDEPAWQWPANGPVLGGFEDGKRKGMAIGGKAGDPVYAAADGRVVYAGSGLRGYGNLVIIKHNAQYLTAYAHNQTLLVKEDQAVRKGQKIAEMGNTDTDRVQLHFEVRKQGKPIDPAKSLPQR